MGMIDNNTKLSVAQAVTSTGDTASANTYDSGSVHSADMGLVGQLWLTVLVSLTATSAGAATVAAVLQDSADGSTWADVLVGQALPVASLTAGTVMMQVQPPVGTRRHIRVVYRVGTAALTAGRFEAFIALDVQRNIARPSGFTVP